MAGSSAGQQEQNDIGSKRRRRNSKCFCRDHCAQEGNRGSGNRIHCSPVVERKTAALRLLQVSADKNSTDITMDHGKYHGQVNEFGERNGHGQMTYTQGDKYAGEFLRDQRYGMGKYVFMDGCKYIGEWKNDVFDGVGTYYDPYGNIYHSGWKKGMRNGLGMFIFADGRVEVGLCAANFHVGLGIRWSANRSEAWEVIDGRVTRKLPIFGAKKVSEINGLPIPKKDLHQAKMLPIIAA